ncbi:MAG: glycosyltransferase family A protein [Campylobacterota bacterium]|nr:glycosyltransferase family A protein [Campylobacterota bacterium]
MKISVIIPTYNRSEFIVKTIQTVLNQTVKVDEVIVIDDGSTDDTQNILKPFCDTNLNKIKYIKQKNSGVSSARNLGIKISSNDWLCFLDSDDLWEDTKIEEQIKFHKQNKNILFSHTLELWLFNDKVIKQKKHQQKQSGFCFKQNISNTLIGASTVMIHKSILDDVGLFDEDLKVCEDYDLWLRILYKYELGIIEKQLIKKIAGHKEQLSFATPLMDTYRIKSLQKHLNSKYSQDIKNIIIQKCEILIKGAIKYQNKKIENYYTTLKQSLL